MTAASVASDGTDLPAAPEAVRVTVEGDGGARVTDLPAGDRGSHGSPSFLYLDCGAWMGEGRYAPVQRSFAVVCGRLAVLCEFQAGRGQRDLPAEGPEAAAVGRLLTALAGPQRMDVAVKRWRFAPGPDDAETGGAVPVPTVFLPDMHLALVGRMPDLDPELVPDPSQATCWCHGPIFARIDGTAPRPMAFKVVGSFLTRNPNDWFYQMAGTYRAAAEDLVRFLDRLARYGAGGAYDLVHLGGLFDVWAGFKCVFHSMGFAGLLEPRIVAGVGEAEFEARWRDVAVDGRPKEAVVRLLRLPPGRRTLLAAGQGHFGAAGTPAALAGRGQRSLRTPGFFAENRPEPLACCIDQPPHAVVGMLERKAQFIPWTRVRRAGWRAELAAAAAARWEQRPFPVYVMAHTYAPCLTEVWVEG